MPYFLSKGTKRGADASRTERRTPALRPKRAGRHGGYSRMPFGIIDDVTDARVEVIVRAKRDKNSSYRGERTRARQVGNRLCRKFTQKIYKSCLQKS